MSTEHFKGSDGSAGACFAEKGGGIMSEKAIVAMSGGVGGGTIVSADDN